MVGDRTSLLWKLSEKHGEGKTYFDEDLKGQVEHNAQERKDLREVWAEKAERGQRAVRRITLWKILTSVRLLHGGSACPEAWAAPWGFFFQRSVTKDTQIIPICFSKEVDYNRDLAKSLQSRRILWEMWRL